MPGVGGVSGVKEEAGREGDDAETGWGERETGVDGGVGVVDEEDRAEEGTGWAGGEAMGVWTSCSLCTVW